MKRKKEKIIVLGPEEKVLAVVPEFCAGPGWANTPVWVYIGNFSDKTFRQECLQPEEQSEEIGTLFSIGVATNAALIRAIKTMGKKR